MKRPGLSAVFLSLAALLLCLVAVETVLVIWDQPQSNPPRRACFTEPLTFYPGQGDDPGRFYTLSPKSLYLNIYDSNPDGYFEAGNTITIEVNNLGFRGDDIIDGDRSFTGLKVAFLGDSFTLGEGVKIRDTFAEKIAARINADPDRTVPVKSYNFGMPGYNTTQAYWALKTWVLPLRPDLVVLGYFLNDAAGPYFTRDPRTGAISGDPANPFFWPALAEGPPEGVYRLRTARLIRQRIQQILVARRTVDYYLGLYTPQNPHWETNRHHLKAIIHECRRHRIGLVVVCLPVFYRLDGDYPFKKIHQTVREVVAAEAAAGSPVFVDMLPYFQGLDSRRLWVHPSDHHPNALAHAMIADVLAPIVVDLLDEHSR